MLWIVSLSIFAALVTIAFVAKKWGERSADAESAEHYADVVDDVQKNRDAVAALSDDDIDDELWPDDKA